MFEKNENKQKRGRVCSLFNKFSNPQSKGPQIYFGNTEVGSTDELFGSSNTPLMVDTKH